MERAQVYTHHSISNSALKMSQDTPLNVLLAQMMEEQAVMLQWQAAKLKNFSAPAAPAKEIAATVAAPAPPVTKKEKRDPNKPKRAPSAYQLFMRYVVVALSVHDCMYNQIRCKI